MQKETLVQITGTVETIVYKNEETGFTVLELDKDGELITVVGELSAVGEGEILTLHGSFRTPATVPNLRRLRRSKSCPPPLPQFYAIFLRAL